METKAETQPMVKTRLKAKPPEETKPGKTKGLMFGASGVGKTWFTLRFPTPYYIDTEGGADGQHYQKLLKEAGGAYMGPEEGALDFGSVIEQMQALATEAHPYRTLVIDSITKLYQTTIANEAERLGEKDAFGASKKPAIASMRRMVNWAMKLDMNIWFIAHETAEWGVNPRTQQREEIGKVPDVWDKLIYELDLTLHAQKRGSSRVAVVRKSRLLGFPDADTFDLDYDLFSERYGRETIEADTSRLVLASPEQVAEIDRLLGVLKVPEAEIEKVLTKASADNWSELTTKQAESTINWLKKKLS
jgi:hypothetical protein